MTTAGARCPRLVTPDRLGGQHPLCDACTRDLLDRLLRNPRWREHVVARLARDEVDQARGAAEAAATREAIEQRERTAEARAVEREADAVHVVYYVRTGDHSIKIGTTGHLTERMRAFRVANPDNLLAAEPGGYDLEQRRHHQFRAWRYHRRREDFGDGDDLLEHIAGVRAEHGDPWTVGGAR